MACTLQHGRDNQGITLVELLVVLTWMGILLALSAAYWHSASSTTQSAAYIQSISQFVRHARAQALYQQARVLVCTANAQGQCIKQASDQLVSFIDHDHNRQWSDGDQPLQQLTLHPFAQVQIRPLHKSYIQFGATGLAQGAAGHLLLCPHDGNLRHAAQLIVNLAGRLKLAQDTDDNGIVNGVNGQDLVCTF